MRRFSIALAATLAMASFDLATAAENQISDPTTLVDSVDVTTLGKLIAEIGGQKVETRESGDKKYVTFFNGEQPYVAMVTLCDIKPGKCLAVLQLALIDTSPLTVSLDQLNKINGDNVYLTGFKLDGNKMGFGHVLIVDGGVTRQNLASNVGGFVGTFEDTMKKLANPVTSSLQPGQAATAVAATNVQFHPIQADPRHISYLADQLLAQYRGLLTRDIRH
jgi:hypothetical protein